MKQGSFSIVLSIVLIAALTGCEQRLKDLGRPPTMTAIEGSREAEAMNALPFPRDVLARRSSDHASLWSLGQESLLGDRRARKPGDILTVVVEINDEAEFSNTSKRSRGGRDSMTIGGFLGIPSFGPLARIDLNPGVSTKSTSESSGNGSTRRNEQLTLRVAATVVRTLPNGILQIQGSQEVRVNYELRELLVTGYVRPQDISRKNEIPYDKIASARISYGGRGQIMDVQQPRIGQQITDMILPF